MCSPILSRRITPPVMAAAIVLLNACAAPSPSDDRALSSSAAAQGDADKLLVVDCLLPSQIRKLGRQLTYLAPRRPIKTTTGDCEIRGGEYVLYDRADYRTALRIWLPSAESGDPVAQTYLGEIYERGLGTAPDHALAAQWYRKAADQGYSRAQINLGALYEQGRGVPRDPTRAVALYRQAAGLTGDPLAFSASSPQAADTERAELRRELALREREVSLLRTQLQQTQEQIDTRRQRLEETQRELESTRRQMQQQRSAPPAPTRVVTVERIGTDPQLQQRLASQQALIEKQRQEMAKMEREQGKMRADLRTIESRAKGREQELEALRAQLQQTERQLEARRGSLDSTQRALEETRRQLQQGPVSQAPATPAGGEDTERLQKRLAEQEALLASQKQEIAFLQQQAESQQAQLRAERRAAEKRTQGVEEKMQASRREQASLQQQVEYLQKQLNQYQAQLTARKQELETQRSSVQQAEQALTPPSSAPSDAAELQKMRQQLASRNEELSKSQQRIAKLEADVQRRRQELEKLMALRAQEISQEKTASDTAAQPAALASRGSEPLIAAAPSAAPAAPKLEYGRYYALIIGNNRYTQFPSLETAVSDAQALAQILKSRYGFETRVLLNANRYDILAALNEFREKLTDKDNFLLYYAGHGELDKANERGHWLPVDAEPNSTANWISNVQVTDILNAMNVKHAMVIADSCYSGTLTRSVTTSIEGGRSPEKRLIWLQQMIGTRSRTVLTSGGLSPVLDGGGGGHSIFANALLDILKENRDVLEGPLLYRQTTKRVKASAARLKVEQEPRYAPIKFAGDLGAPFFFVPTQ